MKSKPSLAAEEISTSLLDLEHVVPPMALVLVKGWTRSLAFYAVMTACYEEAQLLEVSCFYDRSKNYLPTIFVICCLSWSGLISRHQTVAFPDLLCLELFEWFDSLSRMQCAQCLA